jgi:hypothetical protein
MAAIRQSLCECRASPVHLDNCLISIDKFARIRLSRSNHERQKQRLPADFAALFTPR